MAKPYDPNTFAPALPQSQRLWTQSVQNALDGGVELGSPTQVGSTSAGVNAGVASQFDQANGSGKLFRIAAASNTSQNAPYNWVTNGVGVVINHGLGRVPIGFHVADSDGNSNLYRTAAPDQNQITIATTDVTVSNTVYVF